MPTSQSESGADSSPSTDSRDMKLLAEVFDYLKHTREDVRKMAIQSLAQQSKDDPQVAIFLSSSSHGPDSIVTLMRFLHVVERGMVGDVLTLLVNCAAHGECTEALCRAAVVPKAMRLLMEIELVDCDDPPRSSAFSAHASLPYSSTSFLHGLSELTLMLLSNMTSSHVSAVEQLLQVEKEDMEGFYLDKLKALYDSVGNPKTSNTSSSSSGSHIGEGAMKDEEHCCASDGCGEESSKHGNEASRDSASSSSLSTRNPAQTNPSPSSMRDLRRWILQILLNLTRSRDGQRLVLQNSDWRETLCDCLSSSHVRHRLLAAQCYRNCGCTQNPHYSLLLESEALEKAVARLVLPEPCEEVQLCLAEFVAYMLANEKGMARLEGINARQMLLGALDTASASATQLQCGECHSSDVAACAQQESVAPVAEKQPLTTRRASTAPVLSASVCEFIHKQVLPYLDDIVDAYIAPGSDALD